MVALQQLQLLLLNLQYLIRFLLQPHRRVQDANGTATVIITGGVSPYNYSWVTSPVQTNVTATGLAAGTNFVTVTDANGCQLVVAVIVPSQSGIGINLISPVYAGGYNVRCNGGNDGAINMTVSGTGPFTYLWSNSETTEDIFNLTAGVFI